MDQPSSPRSPRERAASSEPCSTRPNPFDDDEHSARKRRRTSLSGGASPCRSSGPGTEGSPAALETHKEATRLPPDDVEMRLDTDPSGPRTPEQSTVDTGASAEPVSSRVTINLRNTQQSSNAIQSSPLSSKSQAGTAQHDGSDDVKLSVESSVMDGLQLEMPTSTPTSSAMGGSPPVEVIHQPEDEGSLIMDEPQILLVQENQVGDVPAPEEPPSFPYRNEDEHQQESLQRASTHILTHEKMTTAIDRYVGELHDFTRAANYPALIDAYQRNMYLWQGLPDIISCAHYRRNTTRDRDIRATLPSIFSEFAALTASFVIFDLSTLHRVMATADLRELDLISPFYLPVLIQLCVRDETSVQGQYGVPYDAASVATCFASCLARHAEAGVYSVLFKLARAQVDLLGSLPRLSDNLDSICQLYFLVATLDAQNSTERPRQWSHIAFELYSIVAAALSKLTEKGITNLSHEHTGCLIRHLGDVMKLALLNPEHPGALKLVEEFRRTYPLIHQSLVPEVISSRYRFTMFSKLIMSSQMQLRVMAVTSMCNDMVACWKRFSEPANDSRNLAVQHFFADYLLQSDLISYILGPTCHPEITAESGNIIGFLLVTNTYTEKHTDLLWQTATTTQDPRISDALLRMFCRIVQLLHYDGLLYFCQKFNTLPIEAFTPTVRELVDHVLRHASQKTPHERLETAPYRLCVRLMRESSILGAKLTVTCHDIREFATGKFKELLAYGPDAEGRAALYEECIQDIASKSPTTVGSLSAIWNLMHPSRVRELPMLISKYSFAQLLVDELEHAVSLGRKSGYPAVIDGQQNAPRREMLSLLLQSQPNALTSTRLGNRLWGLMVGKDAACPEDRTASWRILNNCKSTRPDNEFVAVCWTEYLPSLPSEYLCSGTLDLIRLCVLPAVNSPSCDLLDDQDSPDWAAIEQIWRMIMTTNDPGLEQLAIQTLVSDIYLNSESVRGFSIYRARKVHLAFVDRCLKQLLAAAERLRTFSGDTSSGDDENMVVVASESQMQEQSSRFIRSLKVLKTFHHLHSEVAYFATPDLPSLPLALPDEVEGDPAGLKFQGFDGETNTEVKTLHIGRRNTASSLLASLQEATGFENYRIFYRGKPFVPREADICKSLEDLQIHDGFLLVKRESVVTAPAKVRPGASPVEVEILSHFDKLWDCLAMDEPLANEIYSFLIKLPLDEQMLSSTLDSSTSPTVIFPPGQTFKSLYAVSVLNKLVHYNHRAGNFLTGMWSEVLKRPLSDITGRIFFLAAAALRSDDVVEGCPTLATRSQMIKTITMIITTVLEKFVLIRNPKADEEVAKSGAKVVEYLDGELLERLVSLLISTTDSTMADDASELALKLFHAILACAVCKRGCWDEFVGSTEIPEQIKRLLLEEANPVVRSRVQNGIMALFKERNSLPAVSPAEVERFFWDLICQLVTTSQDYRDKSREAFELWKDLFQIMKESNSATLDVQETLDITTEMLISYETWEDVTQPDYIDVVPQVLAHMMMMMLNPKDVLIDTTLTIMPTLPRKIFWKHLFPPWTRRVDHPLPRPVIHPQTRQLLTHTLMLSVASSRARLDTLLADLKSLVPCDPGNDEDPYHYDIPFNFDRNRAIRSPCGYAGLRNLSNTCYLNSLFTQLFMNVGFRKFMLEAKVQDPEYTQKLLFTTQKVFAYLQDSHQRFIDPADCVDSIRTYDDTPIDIHNQMDVDEFYNLLFDRWEAQLPSAESKKTFRSFYGGQLVQQVRSQECEHISERLEPFSAIQCDIKGKSSLQESLEAYVEGEIMGGDNKYKCSTCDRHVDAVKRACLKDIPNNLIFHLKRFDFNLRSLTRNKINDFFSFPTHIDMRPYTVEHLADPSKTGPPDMFELVGVLVHSGTAESGHYYSYIRERPTPSGSQDTWVEFNDDMVTAWDPQLIEGSCFGGSEIRAAYDGTSQPFDKTYSAYMLFYQRSSDLAREQEILTRANEPGPLRAQVPADLAAHIHQENTLLLRRHCLFDPGQINLVHHAMVLNRKMRSSEDKFQWTKADSDTMEMVLGHLDQVASRAKDLPEFNRLLMSIYTWTREDKNASSAVLKYFSDRPIAFQRMVQRSPDAQVRKNIVQVMISVIETAQARWHQSSSVTPRRPLDLFDEGCYLQQAMRLIDELWSHFHVNIRSWAEVFGFMLSFVLLGRLEKAVFLDHDHLYKLVLIIAADSNDSNPQFARMAQAVSRRMATRQPNYDAIIGLLADLLACMQGPKSLDSNDSRNMQQVLNTRLYAAYRDQTSLHEMTTHELGLIGRDWPRTENNIFLDKLLCLGQSLPEVEEIIAALVRISSYTQSKVFDTLVAGITGAMVSYPVTPFLRAAVVCCRTSQDRDRVNDLFMQICEQSRNLQNNEGRAFLDFHRDVFHDLLLTERESQPSYPADGLDNVHRWAPGLLNYLEPQVGGDVIEFLKLEIFNFGPSHEFPEDSGGEARSKAVDIAAQRLGWECIRFLNDQYITRQQPCQHQVGKVFESLFRECDPFFAVEADGSGPMFPPTLSQSPEIYWPARREVIRQLQQLMVEELDDDASEWENSCESSEPMDSIGDFTMQTTGELIDAELQ
ncbi:hypothetical protein MCOR25_009252 [Pyricularia grisea]|nr:hypothetical protein MCOR25_009252 [Pyricularia grisea]